MILCHVERRSFICARRGPEDLASDYDYGYRRLLWEDRKVRNAQVSVGGTEREHGDGDRRDTSAVSGRERGGKGRRRDVTSSSDAR